MESTAQKIITVARQRSLFRAADVHDALDPRSTLRRMTQRGELIQVGRGLYSLPDAEIGASHSLVEAHQRFPGGVICLVSALAFHGIGTQIPYETWIMRRDRKASPRREDRIHFLYCTSAAFEFGMESHRIEGIPVRVYSPARTVADCFKYRNKIGLDVALESLREGWNGRRFTMDELWAASVLCRVQGIIRPYLEMLVQ